MSRFIVSCKELDIASKVVFNLIYVQDGIAILGF